MKLQLPGSSRMSVYSVDSGLTHNHLNYAEKDSIRMKSILSQTSGEILILSCFVDQAIEFSRSYESDIETV